MSSDLNNIISELKKKMETNNIVLNKILNLEEKKLDTKQIKLLVDISTNINELDIRLEELYLSLIDNPIYETTADERIKIRNNKIDSKVKEILLPYMFYMRMILENN